MLHAAWRGGEREKAENAKQLTYMFVSLTAEGRLINSPHSASERGVSRWVWPSLENITSIETMCATDALTLIM